MTVATEQFYYVRQLVLERSAIVLFEALRRHIIPDLLKRNARGRRLAIWSAAYSSGQELYSVAMLLDEEFPLLRVGWQVDRWTAT